MSAYESAFSDVNWSDRKKPPKAELQHQRPQERRRLGADAEQRAADDAQRGPDRRQQVLRQRGRPSGTLMKKIQRQCQSVLMKPPSGGPRTGPSCAGIVRYDSSFTKSLFNSTSRPTWMNTARLTGYDVSASFSAIGFSARSRAITAATSR